MRNEVTVMTENVFEKYADEEAEMYYKMQEQRKQREMQQT